MDVFRAPLWTPLYWTSDPADFTARPGAATTCYAGGLCLPVGPGPARTGRPAGRTPSDNGEITPVAPPCAPRCAARPFRCGATSRRKVQVSDGEIDCASVRGAEQMSVTISGLRQVIGGQGLTGTVDSPTSAGRHLREAEAKIHRAVGARPAVVSPAWQRDRRAGQVGSRSLRVILVVVVEAMKMEHSLGAGFGTGTRCWCPLAIR